jgi:hypothetical protein
MNFMRSVAIAAFLVSGAVTAFAQQNVNIRGTISKFDGKTIAIRTNDGRDLSVDLPEGAPVATTKAFTLADVKPGMKLGVTTIKRADGATVAIDVRPIPAAARDGLSPYDLQPQSTMTNAVLEATAAAAAGAQELTLNYQSGVIKVLVPPGTPMSQSAPGQRMDVKPGETIFVAARSEGGKLVAARVQVSKDGVKPTQ